MGLGDGGPDTRSGLAASLAEQPVRFSGKFLGATVMLWSGHRAPRVSLPGPGSDTTHAPGDSTYGGMPVTATGPGTGRRIGA